MAKIQRRIHLTPDALEQWNDDLEMLRIVLNIPDQSQAIRTAVHIAALQVRKLAMRTGEQTRIYPNGKTWTLQIGDLPLNVVEGLPSADAALKLVLDAN